MKKTYTVREVEAVYTHGYHVSETRREYAVTIEPYGIMIYTAPTRERAEAWLADKLAREEAAQ